MGLAFHPKFAANGRFYLFYSVILPDGIRCERVCLFHGEEGGADPASERVLSNRSTRRSEPSGLLPRFGPDGYLYVSLGDEGGQNDQFDNTQRIDKNFFSGILRIDVDKKPGSLPPNPHPAVPPIPASPVTTCRRTIRSSTSGRAGLGWRHNGVRLDDPAKPPHRVLGHRPAQSLADALRSCYRRPLGGGCGRWSREEINIVTRGGNYGWPYREGFTNGPKKPRPGEWTSNPIDPLFDYTRGTGTGQGNSVTGGLVYQGTACRRFPEVTSSRTTLPGIVWSLRRVERAAPSATRITGEAGITVLRDGSFQR